MNDRAYTRAQRLGLLASTLAQTISSTSMIALAPLAALIQSDFGLTRAELGLLLGAGALGGLVVALPGGWLSDVFGVRRVVFGGMLVGGLCFCVLSLSGSALLAALLLFFSGLGTGVIPPATTKAIMVWFTARVRGTAMGIKQTGFPIGGALTAAILPGLALSLGGWRPALLAVGVVSIMTGGLYWLLYADHPGHAESGAVRRAGLSLFRPLLSDKRILALAALGFCYGYNLATLSGYMSLYLHETLGMDLVLAGAYLMACQASGAVGRLAFGVISDRFYGGRRAPVLLAVTAANGVLALGFGSALPLVAGWAQTALILALGVTAIGWSSLYHVFVGETAGRQQAGTAVGFCLMVCAGGNVLGPPLFGYIVDATGSYSLAWSTQALLAAFGVSMIFLLNRLPAPAALPLGQG